MTKSRKWLFVVVSGLLIATIALCGFSLAAVSSVQAATNSTAQHPDGPGLLDVKFFLGVDIDYDIRLADALGITVDELNAARQKADQAAIDLIVEQDMLTEDEAALMKARNLAKDAIDPQALKAEALGMTADGQTCFNCPSGARYNKPTNFDRETFPCQPYSSPPAHQRWPAGRLSGFAGHSKLPGPGFAARRW